MILNICIVTFPISSTGTTPLSNLVKLLSEVADRVYVVSGGKGSEKMNLNDNVKMIRVDHKHSTKAFMRIVNYVRTQFRILLHVIMISRKVDLAIFFIGGQGLLLPMMALRLQRKKIILMPADVTTKVSSLRGDPLSKFMLLLVKIGLYLPDKLILYSRNFLQEGTFSFSKHKYKAIIAHRHFVNFTVFTMRKKNEERANIVGYIGRLSEEKGILNHLKAIPLVLKEVKDARFIICGTGELCGKIQKIVKHEGLEAHVSLTGWIPHADIPRYLNELKLLVLPSFTEGLPNIVLEAMACGTPILAASVGAIPDVIIEAKNGFLLKSTTPKHIAERIVVLLNNPNLLERVSKDAYIFVREEFHYEKTLEIWRNVLKQLDVNAKD